MSRCADFNSWPSGSVSYTDHGAGANLNIITSLSIDAWVKFKQGGQNVRAAIFIRSVPGVGGYYLTIYRNHIPGKNTLTFTRMTIVEHDSDVDIVNGTPVHIAITYNLTTGDTIFYRNGVAVQTMNNMGGIVSAGVINSYINANAAGSGFNGCVYSLNVYNRVLSLAEINYNMQHPADAIRRGRQLGVTQESWQGGVWKDLSPNAYDGTPTGVVLSPNNNIAGRCVLI